MKKQNLDELAGGAVQELFAKAFERVMENMADPNTAYKDARKITISLKFTQNEQRDDVVCDVSVTEKLAPQAGTRTAFMVGRDLKSGDLYAEEYGRNQMSINFDVDRETGEVREPAKPAGVIDLRHAN